MDPNQFRLAAHAAIEQIISYHENTNHHRTIPHVEGDRLQANIPASAPDNGESWNAIQKDFEQFIVPRMTNWNSPGFAAFFPATTSYPSMLGELFSASFGSPLFSWICSPAAVELEEIVMDWLANALALPTSFAHSHPSSLGGGLIMSSASESVITVMAAARDRMLDAMGARDASITAACNWRQREAANFVVLGSETSHSSIMKAAKVLNLQYVSAEAPASNGFRMTKKQLCRTIQSCLEKGLTPIFAAVTMGTTSTCAVDDLKGIANLLKDHPLIWGHVDAAYAGSVLMLPEYQTLSRVMGSYDSFTVNLNKWMLVNLDASCLFVRNKGHLASSFTCFGSYLQVDKNTGRPEYEPHNLTITLTRRFRSLKIWFVLRSYGLDALRENLRRGIQLGEDFANLLKCRDGMFEIISGSKFGVVTFRVRPQSSHGTQEALHERSNEITREVCQEVNASGQVFLTGCTVGEFYVIRVVTSHTSMSPASLRSIMRVLVQTASSIA